MVYCSLLWSLKKCGLLRIVNWGKERKKKKLLLLKATKVIIVPTYVCIFCETQQNNYKLSKQPPKWCYYEMFVVIKIELSLIVLPEITKLQSWRLNAIHMFIKHDIHDCDDKWPCHCELYKHVRCSNCQFRGHTHMSNFYTDMSIYLYDILSV